MLDLDIYLSDIDSLVEATIKDNTLGFSKKELKKAIKENSITGSGLKAKLTRLIAHSPDALANEVPEMFDVIYYCITVGVPTMIFPVLVIPSFIAAKVIKDSADAKVIGRYISTYNLEIAKVERQLEKEEDPNIKKFLEEYKDDLEKSKTKLSNKKEELRNLGDSSDDFDSKTRALIREALYKFDYEYAKLTPEQKAYLYENTIMLDEGMLTPVKTKAKEIKKGIKRKEEAMDKWFDDTLKGIRNAARNKTRDEIVEDSFPKLSKMIKRAIVVGASFAINPTLAAMSAAVLFVLSKKATLRERQKLLRELNRELEMVEEKIRDADSASDKKKKYELMRLRFEIQNNIDKIKRHI